MNDDTDGLRLIRNARQQLALTGIYLKKFEDRLLDDPTDEMARDEITEIFDTLNHLNQCIETEALEDQQ
jgi:ABC-type branched-subunit amino acid transport system ATPase component